MAEEFLDYIVPLGMDGVTMASAFRYPDAPDQDHFFGRRRTFEFFEKLLAKNKKGRWDLNHSPLYLQFLRGKKDYSCTPWGNPNYSVLGWQKPCYLLDDGYAETFKELMEAMQQMTGLNVVGGDVVELAPHYDQSGVSTAVACKVVRELVLILAG